MKRENVTQLSLPLAEEMGTVHCFFHCGYTTQAVEPETAHALMEKHYEKKHAKEIDRIIGRLT